MATSLAADAHHVSTQLYRYYLEILGVAGCITFLMGWYGFSIAAAQPNTPVGFLDTAYYSLQLFLLDGPGPAIAVDNLPLQIARFLAPALMALSIIAFAMRHVTNRYLLAFYLKWIAEDHVVICGLGYGGPEIALKFAGEGRTVVVVEKDAANPEIESCRKGGVYVLVDDADRESVLRRVQVQKAGDAFIVTGNDTRNLGITYTIKAICENDRGTLPPLRAHCHIGDAEFCSSIRGKTLLTAGEGNIVIEPFNIYQIAGYCLTKADTIFEREPGRGEPDQGQDCGSVPADQPIPTQAAAPRPDLHLLIIGVGRLGEALLVRMVRRWRELGDGSRLRVTVIDAEADAKRAVLNAKYPALRDDAEISWLSIRLDHADAVLGDAALTRALPSVTHTYFCIDDPSLGLSVALTLSPRASPGSITRIRSLRRSELSPLIEQFSASLSECRRITEFHITSDPCCLSIVCRGMSEQIARLNHDAYLESQRRLHGRDVRKPSVVPWESLMPEKRDSNREQAFDLGNKLSRINYTVAPLTDWNERLVDFGLIPFGKGSTALEEMARWEHERWMAEKLRKGWRYADIPRQIEEKRLHPDLKPYDELSDAVKGYDRDYIRSIPPTLGRMDLKLVPDRTEPLGK